MEQQIPYACIDGFNTKMIWKYEPAAAETGVQLPKKRSRDRTSVLDQHEQELTKNACTVYGSTKSKHDAEDEETLDPIAERRDALLRGARKDFGWSLQGATLMFMDKGHIKGYAYTDTKDDMKRAIYDTGPIFTGSNQCSRSKTFADPRKVFYVVKDGQGHAFEMSGRDDDYVVDNKGNKGAFECTNSSKKNPRFRVPYNKIDKLFSRIVFIVDVDWVQKKKLQEDLLMMQRMIDKGITNGQDLDKEIERRQVAIMIGRAMYGPGLSDNEYMERTVEAGIWNGQKQYAHATRYELMVMLARYILPFHQRILLKDHQLIEFLVTVGVTNGNNQSDTATRKSCVLMVGRAMRYLDQN